MSGATETGGTVGIVELVAICAEMRGRCRGMFRAIGQWVPDESDPVAQRRYAIASHRHAWHADLWDERLPKIPVDAIGVDSVTILPPDRWYPAALDETFVASLALPTGQLDAWREAYEDRRFS